MRTGRLLIVWLAAFAPSCASPSSPTQGQADLRGSYGGLGNAWRWNESDSNAPGSSRSTSCDGGLDITSQDGSSFGGRYSIDCSLRGRGRFSGTVREGRLSFNNQVSFRLVTEEGGDPGIPSEWSDASCKMSDPQRYEGSLAGGSLSVSRFITLDCPQGNFLLASTFQGTRR